MLIGKPPLRNTAKMVLLARRRSNLKWHNLYGRLLSYQRLYEAWLKVKANRGAGGVDGISLSAFESKLEENLQELLRDLKAKTYKPMPVLRRYIPKRNGKKRPLGLPSIRDKVVQQAVVDILQPLYETEFHPASVGFRPGKGAFNAFGRIIHLMEQGYVWVYDADIKGYFDCIDHRILLEVMKRRIADRSILDLIWQWLKAGVMENGVRSFSKAGTPQGGVISPLLANVYLNELDWELSKAGVQFVRYADDFLVFAKNEEGVKHGENIVRTVMKRLKLELSVEKTKTLHLMEERTSDGRIIPELEYLGVAIQGWFRKRDGTWSFGLKCTSEAMKDFRVAVKEKTPKTHTLSLAALVERVNPIIMGKAAYWAQAAKAVQVYKSIRGRCRCATALLGQQTSRLDAYVRQRIRRCRLPQRGGSKTYRRANMLRSIYTHERLIKAGLRYAERIVRDAATGLPLTDDEYLALIRQRREKAAAAKRQRKADDAAYWAKRAAAYQRAQERVRKFESK
ncbi:group II intron reverse transcriptase/maturase [Kyrpidia spormannii]|uniref:Group II intron reverse transcriptase/maturase n=1 Tax=Kyrpidia spormannii TaxID=2055160 RepID=A0A2K8N2Y3_9BACL|nr:group II intron reverse transcriptase/maturase [Kyrpidia spormannii]ATY83873.1 group II intron reverse transcriptase/maturase [Kyrpidia spormannii]